MADQIQKNNEGTRFQVTITENGTAVDISSATAKEIRFKKPDGSATVVKAATFLTDGSDGIMYYDSEAGFLDVIGGWRFQGYVVLVTPRAWDGYSEVKAFTVHDNV